MRALLTTAALAGVMALAPAARAETILVPADRDATLIEDADGVLANGSGSAFFAGRTNQRVGSVRRGLIRFDVAGSLPRHAILESVTLRLTARSGNPGTSRVRLYRVLADWGEGPSASAGGSGAPAQTGDATWIHTFYDTAFWEYAGGQFVGRDSATFEVDGPGTYEIAGDPKLLADVRLWAAAPSRNFGWIVIGDESRPQSVQPFASREADDAGEAPVLEITFRVAGEPRPR